MEITHSTLIDWVNGSEDATDTSRASSEKCRDYYDSKQLTADEVATLKKRGQAPVVINRVKPKMDGLFGMERANRTTCKAYPRTPKHENDSTAVTEAVRYVLQDNFYPVTRSALWGNMCVEGTGGLEIVAKPVKDDIQIKINFIQWDRLIYDPHSRRKNFADARYLGQVVWMDVDEASGMYPDKVDLLTDLISGSGETYDDKPRWVNGTRRRVKIVELYYRNEGEVYYCCFTRGGFLKDPKVSPYLDEDGQTEWPYEFESAFVDREGNRYGAMKQLLDVQDEINKRRSKALHLMSVRQVRLEKGSVEDVRKVRAELAKPDGIIETTPGMEFEVLKTGDMAAAQFNLLTESKQEIDSVGVNAAMSGKLEGSASGVALNTRQQAGATEVSGMFDGLKNLDIRVYRKVWNRIRQYWKDEKWIRVTDDEDNVKFVGLNRKMTVGEVLLKQAEQQKLPPEQLEMIKQRIASDPMMQEQSGIENDVSQLDVDIIISDAPDVSNMEVEQFQGLAEVIKSGAPPVLIEALIQSSSIPRKEQLLKRLKGETEIPPQVQAQMQQMQEQGQKLQEELQKVSEENQKLKTQDAEGMAKAQMDAQLKAAQFENDRQNAEKEFQLAAYKQEQELRLAREKAAAEIQLKREIAEADLEIETQRMDAQHVHDERKMEFEQKIQSATRPTEDVLPQLMEGIAKPLEQIGKSMKMLIDLQKQTLDAIQNPPPRKISLSNIEKDSSGKPKGATINTTIQ